MGTPAYNSTYLVRLAFVDKFLSETSEQLASSLQLAYDGGNVAGFFDWQRMGRVTVLEFERQIGEDFEVLADVGREMNQETVVKQLAVELREALDGPAFVKDQTEQVDRAWLVVDTVATALEESQEVAVEGLPCQYPRLRVEVELTFPTLASRSGATTNQVDTALEALARLMGGDLLTHKVEPL